MCFRSWDGDFFRDVRFLWLQGGFQQLAGRIPGLGVRPPGPQVWIHCFCTHLTSWVALIQFAQVLKLFPFTVKWHKATLHQRLSWELVREWKGLDKSRHFGHNRSCQPFTLHAGSSGISVQTGLQRELQVITGQALGVRQLCIQTPVPTFQKSPAGSLWIHHMYTAFRYSSLGTMVPTHEIFYGIIKSMWTVSA